MSTKSNEPVTPIIPTDKKLDLTFTAGLTKREYFAARAMHGMCANSRKVLAGAGDPDKIADQAVTYADALIKCLNSREVKE